MDSSFVVLVHHTPTLTTTNHLILDYENSVHSFVLNSNESETQVKEYHEDTID